jgi:hypothetical protein
MLPLEKPNTCLTDSNYAKKNERAIVFFLIKFSVMLSTAWSLETWDRRDEFLSG